jgi:hypothetical protein
MPVRILSQHRRRSSGGSRFKSLLSRPQRAIHVDRNSTKPHHAHLLVVVDAADAPLRMAHDQRQRQRIGIAGLLAERFQRVPEPIEREPLKPKLVRHPAKGAGDGIGDLHPAPLLRLPVKRFV